MTEPARGSGFRTLTESLRQTQPDSVVTLLSLRPDLAQPVPHDLAELTAHATTSRSVARALDGLTAWQREVAEALAALPDPAELGGRSRAAGRRSSIPAGRPSTTCANGRCSGAPTSACISCAPSASSSVPTRAPWHHRRPVR